MSERMIVLDKQPGVRPVGVGITWRQCFAKISLKVTEQESTMACQYEQLCDRPKAGIDDAVHGDQAIWDEKLTTED